MHKLAELCVKRPVFATMLIVSLTVMGAYSFFGLGVDYFPNIDIPTVAVTVTNPGASAEQIESEITKKVEGAVNTISGISELRSTSSEGQSTVIVTFLLEKDGDVAAQEVRDKVNLLAGQLPETARAPIILKADPGAQPVMQIAVAGSRPLREVTRFAEKEVKEKRESVSGVGQVSRVGGTMETPSRVWISLSDRDSRYMEAISGVMSYLYGPKVSPTRSEFQSIITLTAIIRDSSVCVCIVRAQIRRDHVWHYLNFRGRTFCNHAPVVEHCHAIRD